MGPGEGLMMDLNMAPPQIERLGISWGKYGSGLQYFPKGKLLQSNRAKQSQARLFLSAVFQSDYRPGVFQSEKGRKLPTIGSVRAVCPLAGYVTKVGSESSG